MKRPTLPANDPGPDLLRAHGALSEAFEAVDRAAGGLGGVKLASALDVRDEVAHAMRQVRALALFVGLPAGEL